MLNWLRSLFSSSPEVDYRSLVQQGAIIVDVRTPREYSSGHIKGSVNIPVDQIGSEKKTLRNTDTPVITCCASGARSAAAARVLRSRGFTSVVNGGSWVSLQSKI